MTLWFLPRSRQKRRWGRHLVSTGLNSATSSRLIVFQFPAIRHFATTPCVWRASSTAAKARLGVESISIKLIPPRQPDAIFRLIVLRLFAALLPTLAWRRCASYGRPSSRHSLVPYQSAGSPPCQRAPEDGHQDLFEMRLNVPARAVFRGQPLDLGGALPVSHAAATAAAYGLSLFVGSPRLALTMCAVVSW